MAQGGLNERGHGRGMGALGSTESMLDATAKAATVTKSGREAAAVCHYQVHHVSLQAAQLDRASTHPPGGKPLAAAAAAPPLSAIVSERLCGDAHEHCCCRSVAAAGLKGLPSSGLAGTQTQGFAGRPDAAAAGALLT